LNIKGFEGLVRNDIPCYDMQKAKRSEQRFIGEQQMFSPMKHLSSYADAYNSETNVGGIYSSNVQINNYLMGIT
jgi:hypothetical protein